MKFGIMGTHGTGKSTFAREMAKRAKDECRDGSMMLISGIARECPWPINRDTSEEAQRWIWLKQMLMELLASATGDNIICDRTVLDSLVYADVAGLDEVVDDYLPAALGWMEGYDIVYWMRPVEGRLVEDGKRDVDPAFQTQVDDVFRDWIRIYSIPVTEVNGR